MSRTGSLRLSCRDYPTGALVEEGLDVMEAGSDSHGVDDIES
jgi:hypothetical protein